MAGELIPASGLRECAWHQGVVGGGRSCRGRALEIILGANDFDGDTAERYGYVNRAFPDAELDGFVDTLARRIASFDQRAVAAAKRLVNQVSLPSADRLLDALTPFQATLMWTDTQQPIEALLKCGLQRDSDLSTALGRFALSQ